MTNGRAAGLYALAFLPAAGAAVASSGWLMDLTSHQSSRAPSGAAEWALNIVPAFAMGLLGYWALARFVAARLADGRTIGAHVVRCAALYVVIVALGAVILHDADSQDFWSFGQIVLWLWVAAVGGIVADGFTIVHRDHRGSNTA